LITHVIGSHIQREQAAASMRDRRIPRIEDNGRFVQIKIGSADGLALTSLFSPMGRK